MTIMIWVFDIFAVLLSIASFFLDRRETKAFQREDDLFGKLCLISVAIAVFRIIEDIITPGLNVEELKYGSIIVGYFYNVFDLGLLFIWILFVDFMIYRSEDHLRVIKPGYIKILIGITVIETIIGAFALYAIRLSEIRRSLPLEIWVKVSFYALTFVKIVLLVISLKNLSDYRKVRKGPLMFRGMPFYTPIFWGWLITLILDYRIDLNPLATGLGVFLLYLSLRKERKYIDSETGFFSAEYLTLLSGADKNRNYENGIGIVVNANDDTKAAINILKRAKPDGLDIIRISKETFFLVGEKKSKFVIEAFTQNLNETAKEDGINLSVDYGMREDGESAEALLERLAAGTSAGQCDN